LADHATVESSANPLPQALSLTAIVISFGLTLFLLALARRQHVLTGDDLVEDDIEDQRIAHLEEVELGSEHDLSDKELDGEDADS
jgi:multicomponent Na+:H+ antiporter subunit C